MFWIFLLLLLPLSNKCAVRVSLRIAAFECQVVNRPCAAAKPRFNK
jgi:hypothetical protein